MRPIVKKSIILTLPATMVLPLGGLAYAETPRRIKSQVEPVVSEIAWHMSLKGTVRREVATGADGVVESTKALRGHLVLIQSAEQAIRKWRYEPGPPITTVVPFNFTGTEGTAR